MKHSITKRINEREVARVTISIDDQCNNGSDDFGYSCDLFSLDGAKGETVVNFEGKNYRDIGTNITKKFMLKHFPEVKIFHALSGCDIFGLPTYPLMDTEYHLEHNLKHAMTVLRLTEDEANNLKHYKALSLAKYLFQLTQTRYKIEVKNAIKLLEKFTGERYVIKDKVSPHLYNDLNYVLNTEKNGWNIYKGEKDKKKLKYHLDLSK